MERIDELWSNLGKSLLEERMNNNESIYALKEEERKMKVLKQFLQNWDSVIFVPKPNAGVYGCINEIKKLN